MKILQMTSSLDGGGIERLLYDYYSRMNHSQIQFDFVKVDPNEGILERPLRDMGCNIYVIPPLSASYKQYSDCLKRILKNGEYDAIHCNGGYRAAVALMIAKKMGVKVRIAHSHSAFEPETRIHKAIRKLATLVAKYYATNLFACGKDAGLWMWGENANFHIMRNAIITENFTFDKIKRDQIRSELGINEKFVIGNVARFSYQKNHEFLIDTFAETCRLRDDAVLLLVGRGELEEKIKAKVEKLGLSEQVLFLGVRNDIPKLLNAMDMFVLPSRWEGLPVTIVEVQANGLPALISNAVTKEISFGDNIEYLPLALSAWVEKLVSPVYSRSSDGVRVIRNANYDIDSESHKMEDFYCSI